MVACAMIVGPGESKRHLDRVLRLARRWADTVIVHGDGPDADTLDAIEANASKWQHAQPALFTRDESIVRNQLLELCDQHLDNDDLVVMLDADEILLDTNRRDPWLALRSAQDDERYDSWPVEFWHVWNPDETEIRIDGGWNPASGVRIYRHRRGERIEARAMACRPIPESALRAPTCPPQHSLFRIMHLGYAYPHDRACKHARYVQHDGGAFHSGEHIASIVREPVLEKIA